MSFLSGMVSVDSPGTSMSIDCSNAPGGGTCSGVTASVGGGGPITATGGSPKWTATLPSVTPGNSVTVTATVPVTDSFTGDPSNFTLTVPAPLPGATQGFAVPLGPPVCQGDLATKRVSCDNLVEGNYSLVESGHDIQTVPFSLEGGGTQQFTTNPLNALTPGDVVVLHYTGPSSPAVLTTLHVNTLRADIGVQEGNGFTSMTLLGTTDCQVGEWFYGSDFSQVCTTGGHPAPETFGNSFLAGPPNGTVGLLDEFSGNTTTVTVGQVTGTAPLNGESIYDAYTA